MQFTIDGRLQADVRCEDGAWTVSRVDVTTRPAAADVARFAALQENDIGHFIEALAGEWAETGDDLPAIQG